MEMAFRIIEVPTSSVSIDSATLVICLTHTSLSLPTGETVLVLPQECEENNQVKRYVEQLVNSQQGIDKVTIFDLKQSMAMVGDLHVCALACGA